MELFAVSCGTACVVDENCRKKPHGDLFLQKKKIVDLFKEKF